MSVGDIFYNVLVRRSSRSKKEQLIFTLGESTYYLHCTSEYKQQLLSEISAHKAGAGCTTVERVLQTGEDKNDVIKTFYAIEPGQDEKYYLNLLRNFFFPDGEKNSIFSYPVREKIRHWAPKFRQVLNENGRLSAGAHASFGGLHFCLGQHKTWWLPVPTSADNIALLTDRKLTGFMPENIAQRVISPVLFVEESPMPIEKKFLIRTQDGKTEEVFLTLHGFSKPRQLHDHIRKHMAATCINGRETEEKICWRQWLQSEFTDESFFFDECPELINYYKTVHCDLESCSDDLFRRVHPYILKYYAQHYLQAAKNILSGDVTGKIKFERKGTTWRYGKKSAAIQQYFVQCMPKSALADIQCRPVLRLKGWSYGKIAGHRRIHLVIHSFFIKTGNEPDIEWPSSWQKRWKKVTGRNKKFFCEGELLCRSI